MKNLNFNQKVNSLRQKLMSPPYLSKPFAPSNDRLLDNEKQENKLAAIEQLLHSTKRRLEAKPQQCARLQKTIQVLGNQLTSLQKKIGHHVDEQKYSKTSQQLKLLEYQISLRQSRHSKYSIQNVCRDKQKPPQIKKVQYKSGQAPFGQIPKQSRSKIILQEYQLTERLSRQHLHKQNQRLSRVAQQIKFLQYQIQSRAQRDMKWRKQKLEHPSHKTDDSQVSNLNQGKNIVIRNNQIVLPQNDDIKKHEWKQPLVDKQGFSISRLDSKVNLERVNFKRNRPEQKQTIQKEQVRNKQTTQTKIDSIKVTNSSEQLSQLSQKRVTLVKSLSGAEKLQNQQEKMPSILVQSYQTQELQSNKNQSQICNYQLSSQLQDDKKQSLQLNNQDKTSYQQQSKQQQKDQNNYKKNVDPAKSIQLPNVYVLQLGKQTERSVNILPDKLLSIQIKPQYKTTILGLILGKSLQIQGELLLFIAKKDQLLYSRYYEVGSSQNDLVLQTNAVILEEGQCYDIGLQSCTGITLQECEPLERVDKLQIRVSELSEVNESVVRALIIQQEQ